MEILNGPCLEVVSQSWGLPTAGFPMAALTFLVTWSCLYPSELGVYQGWLSSSKLPSLELGLQADHCRAARMCLWPALGWTLAPARLWSCTCGARLELLPPPEPSPEPSQQNGLKQAAAANLLNVSTWNSTAHCLLLLVGNRALITAGFKCLVTLPKQTVQVAELIWWNQN